MEAGETRDISQQQTTYVAQARDAGFTYQPGELCGLDRAAREVLIAPLHAPDGRLLLSGRRLAYDTLIIAVGSQANDFGTLGVAEHCLMIDSRRQADAFIREMRIRILQCLGQGGDLPIAIVGGGATGMELAAEPGADDRDCGRLWRAWPRRTHHHHPDRERPAAAGGLSRGHLRGHAPAARGTGRAGDDRHARHVRHLPAAVLSGTPIPDFVYRNFGALVSLGDYDAYGTLGRFGLFKGATIRGRLAQRAMSCSTAATRRGCHAGSPPPPNIAPIHMRKSAEARKKIENNANIIVALSACRSDKINPRTTKAIQTVTQSKRVAGRAMRIMPILSITPPKIADVSGT